MGESIFYSPRPFKRLFSVLLSPPIQNKSKCSAATQSEAAEGVRSPLVWMMSTNAADSRLEVETHLKSIVSPDSIVKKIAFNQGWNQKLTWKETGPLTWWCCCAGQGRRPSTYRGTNGVQLGRALSESHRYSYALNFTCDSNHLGSMLAVKYTTCLLQSGIETQFDFEMEM